MALIARSDFYGRPCHMRDACEITNTVEWRSTREGRRRGSIWRRAIITASVPSCAVKNRDKTVPLLITYYLIARSFSFPLHRATAQKATKKKRKEWKRIQTLRMRLWLSIKRLAVQRIASFSMWGRLHKHIFAKTFTFEIFQTIEMTPFASHDLMITQNSVSFLNFFFLGCASDSLSNVEIFAPN